MVKARFMGRGGVVVLESARCSKLGGERVDLALKLPGLDGVAGPGKGGVLWCGEHVCGEGAFVGGAGGIVTRDDFCADAFA